MYGKGNWAGLFYSPRAVQAESVVPNIGIRNIDH